MVRNKMPLYYALYEGKEKIKDKNGNPTGEYKVIYSKPIKIYGNISAAKGEIQSRQFGENENYDKVLVFEDADIHIDEHSVLWIDSLPVILENGKTETPFDYIVKRIARSINCTSIAVSKVNVSV